MAAALCSPAPVTVETGPAGLAAGVNAWNACHEDVVCNSPPIVFTGVEVDASDTVRGTCSSIIRH